MKPLTDADIDKMKLPASKYSMHTVEGSLRLKVFKTGAKTFGYFARNANDNNQFVVLGQYGHGPNRTPGSLTVAQAADQLHLIKQANRAAKAQTKIDQDGAARAPGAADTLGPDTTFFQLFADYDAMSISVREGTDGTRARWRNVIKKHFLSYAIPKGRGVWGQMRVREFAGASSKVAYTFHLKQLQMQPAKGHSRTGKCTLGGETQRKVYGLLQHAVLHGLLTVNDLPPRLKGLQKERAINRYLSVDEIESLLRATEPSVCDTLNALPLVKGKKQTRMKEYDACYLRMLLLTGGRVNSVRLARRSMRDTVKKGFLTFPAADMKQTVAQKEEPVDHHLPVTKLLARELARVDKSSGAFDYYFPERYAAKRLAKGLKVSPRTADWAKKICKAKRKLLGNVGPKPYTSQALRRTMSNHMRDLEIPNHVIDVAAGRVEKGTDKTYITGDMPDQVFVAFQKYHAFLEACMQGKGELWMNDVKSARIDLVEKETAERWKRLNKAA
jgi:integrase